MDKFDEIKEQLSKKVLTLAEIRGRFQEKKKSLEDSIDKLREGEEKINIYKDVNLLFEKASVVARKKIKDEVELLVTRGLQSIFEDPTVIFKVEFMSRRNQIEADFYLEWEDNGKRIRGNIVDTFGGGVVDVISMILRLVVLELLGAPGPLFLDEPFKMLSKDYIMNAGKFLVELSKIFDRQIILITHDEVLSEYAEKTFKVKLNENGESIVSE